MIRPSDLGLSSRSLIGLRRLQKKMELGMNLILANPLCSRFFNYHAVIILHCSENTTINFYYFPKSLPEKDPILDSLFADFHHHLN